MSAASLIRRSVAERARSLTDTFAGIRPGDVPGFIAAQSAGAAAAAILFRWLAPGRV